METILASHVFDHFGKTFLLDKIEGPGARIRITEIVPDGPRKGRYAVVVNATVLKRILEFAQAPVAAAPVATPAAVHRRPFFTGEQRDAMKKSYYKGVTSAALAVQYGCTAEDIEQALMEEGVEVVDQSLPASDNRRWKNSSSKGNRRAKKPRTSSPSRTGPYEAAGAPWSVSDDTTLTDLHRRGASIAGLVSKFKRSPGSIRSRLQKLGLLE